MDNLDDLLWEYEFLEGALEKRDQRIAEKTLERRRKDDNYFDLFL